MTKRKCIILRKELRELYYKQKLSSFQIARIYDCTACTIINRMKEYNIKRRQSGPRRVNISKRSLYLLYVKKGFSSQKIAKICHCEQSAILNKLKKYKILIRHPKKKINIFKKELKKLYKERKLSAYKIAKIFNCKSGTVYRYLKLYKIKTRPLKLIRITEDRLRNIYIKKKFPLSKIANIYKCCPVTISTKMKKYGILRRSISETSTRHLKNNFNGDLIEKAYIIGFRTGDLRVREDRNLISVGCGTTKLEQIKLIKTLFKPYGPVYLTKKDKRGAFHIDCSLNSSFSFLLSRHDLIPGWVLRNKKSFFSFLAGYADAEGNIGIYNKRAKFRIRSYDKKILYQFHNGLQKLNIKSLFRLDKKSHIDKGGVIYRKDCWGITINERKSLLRLFILLEPLLRHKKRKKDLLKAKKNVILRLKD